MSLAGARGSGPRSGMGLENFRTKRSNRDVEAADFDESELDELHIRTPTEEMDRDRYSVGSASDDEGEKGKGKGKKINGSGRGANGSQSKDESS